MTGAVRGSREAGRADTRARAARNGTAATSAAKAVRRCSSARHAIGSLDAHSPHTPPRSRRAGPVVAAPGQHPRVAAIRRWRRPDGGGGGPTKRQATATADAHASAPCWDGGNHSRARRGPRAGARHTSNRQGSREARRARARPTVESGARESQSRGCARRRSPSARAGRSSHNQHRRGRKTSTPERGQLLSAVGCRLAPERAAVARWAGGAHFQTVARVVPPARTRPVCVCEARVWAGRAVSRRPELSSTMPRAVCKIRTSD